MTGTRIELQPPEISGRSVHFRFEVTPATDMYHQTGFSLSFPDSIDLEAVPERVWWLVFMLCLHSHWAVLRPCTVQIPIHLPDAEIEVWQRLIDSYVATIDGMCGFEDTGRTVEIMADGPDLGPIPRLAEQGIAASAFSGGKDSLVQAGLLAELGYSPILVATTSPIPGLTDHSTRHRARTFTEVRRRRGWPLIEVVSDYRSSWDNGAPSRMRLPFGMNEISDTFLYTAALIAAGYALGATHLFLASENEVSQNHERGGRFMQHLHFMYSTPTQAVIGALLAPAGITFGSLISPLHSAQVQELLTTRYRDLRDLQFTCWKTTDEHKACSECSECKRLALVVLSLDASPSDMGIDLVHMLLHYGDPNRVSRRYVYAPSIELAERAEAQVTRSLLATPARRVLREVIRHHPLSLVTGSGRRAVKNYREIRRLAFERGPGVGFSGYRAGWLDHVDPDLRDGLERIFDEQFEREPANEYADQLGRQRAAIAHMTEPIRGEGA